MKYINCSDKDLVLPGIGKIKAGGTIEAGENFRNANFERVVTEKIEKPKVEKIVEKKIIKKVIK